MKILQPRFGDWFLGIALMGVTIGFPAAAVERGPARVYAQAAMPAQTEARVIVKFKADSGLMRALSATGSGSDSRAARPQHAQALAVRLGVPLSDGRVLDHHTQLIRSTGITSVELAARLSAQSDVEYAVVDVRMRALNAPNDSYYKAGQTTITPAVGQWYLRSPSGDGAASSINAEAAWSITTGKSTVVVAVLDTGITRHPDLNSKVLPGYDFVSDVGQANDGNGRDSDPSDPGDAISAAETNDANGAFFHCGDPDQSGNLVLAAPSSWHGTQTAGLIGAATNNGIGMASVGRDVMLLPLRVLGKCGGAESDVGSAMLWAAGISVDGVRDNTNPAKVINLSLGADSGTACDTYYQGVVNQVLAKGVVVVAAAGNQGLAVGSPANCAGVIAVAGVRHTGTKVGYSDLGNNVVISAPAGNCVNTSGACMYPLLTTSNSGTTGPVSPNYTDDTFHPSLGTSFSAPLVAGTVALMFSVNPNLTPDQVKSALMSTARAFPSTGATSSVRACTAPTDVAQNSECYCTTSTCGAGLLDAGAAVRAVGTLWANITVALPYPLVNIPVVLSGVASTATGSVNPSYLWEIVSGAATFTTPINQPTATLLPSTAGSVIAKLTVNDGTVGTAASFSTISVSGAPAGNISVKSASVAVGDSVVLDGSGSASSGSGSLTIAGYHWTISGGSGSASFVGSTTESKATIKPTGVGNLTVTLTVTDGAGQQNTTSTLMKVTAAPPPAQIIASGGGGAMALGWLLGWLAAVIGVYLVRTRRS